MIRGVHGSKLRVVASRLVSSSLTGAVHVEAAGSWSVQSAGKHSFLRYYCGWASDHSQLSYCLAQVAIPAPFLWPSISSFDNLRRFQVCGRGNKFCINPEC